jgi:hypothetical protein
MQGAFAWIAGGVVTLVGLLGLFLCARAVDLGFAGFGLGLFVFAVLYVFLQIKQAYDRLEAAGRQA